MLTGSYSNGQLETKYGKWTLSCQGIERKVPAIAKVRLTSSSGADSSEFVLTNERNEILLATVDVRDRASIGTTSLVTSLVADAGQLERRCSFAQPMKVAVTVGRKTRVLMPNTSIRMNEYEYLAWECERHVDASCGEVDPSYCFVIARRL